MVGLYPRLSRGGARAAVIHALPPLCPGELGGILYPEDRSERSSIIEVSMFAGRTAATKRRLIQLLFERIETQLGVAPQDVEISITKPRRGTGASAGAVATNLRSITM